MSKKAKSERAVETEPYRIKPGRRVNLAKMPTRGDGGLVREDARLKLAELGRRLQQLQELLYADGGRALLVVLQAMDAGGKDSTVRKVFAPINPAGCKVVSFKAPNDVERKHDFLWRIHQNTPRKGYIGVFNRSHYEDVLIVRVKNLVPKRVWQPRYDHINAFERMLHDEGTKVVKFMLHISKDYQKQRLERRLAMPEKHWKFNPEDLAERKRWDQYQKAFEVALSKCSTEHAPWYVVPAERRWFRNLLITQVLVDQLEAMKLKYPPIDFDPKTIVVD